jgi:hypothetical protein
MMAKLTQSFDEQHGPTEADRTLAREASALGPDTVSEWQIKRWREDGQLRTLRRFPGHGGGSDPASYPPEAAAHAACLADALSRNVRLDEACLICFRRGFSPRERTLKRSYAASYKRVTTWLSRTAGGSADTWELADAAAALLSRRSARIPQARAARARLREAGKPPGTLRDVLTNVISLVLGASGGLRPETLVAFGMEGLLKPAGELGPLATSEDLKVGWLNLESTAGATDDASMAELEFARDQFADLFEIATLFASNLTDTYGLQLDQLTRVRADDLTAALFGIPATLLMRQRLNSDIFDSNLELLRVELPRMQAMRRLLDSLPAGLHPYTILSAAEIEALPTEERDRLHTEVQKHFAAYPDDLAQFAPPSGDTQETETD